ncbi:hypothetical protein JHK85_034666 [Glycine max]|nr:hypothetical protein JHK85_034666 [Glycine max]KAG4986342.1 hypothetical protein JHK86_034033 [Glycine max]
MSLALLYSVLFSLVLQILFPLLLLFLSKLPQPQLSPAEEPLHNIEIPNGENARNCVVNVVLIFHDDPTVNKSEIVVLLRQVWWPAGKERVLREKRKNEIVRQRRLRSNELSGKGIGASVGVAQYGKDLIKLKQILSTLYESSKFKPSLVAPGGFYEKYWYERLLQVSGSGIINVLTHHLYNLGPDSDEHLERKILDPEHLSGVESICIK